VESVEATQRPELSLRKGNSYSPPPLITKELFRTWKLCAVGSIGIHTQRKHFSQASTATTPQRRAQVEVTTLRIALSFMNRRFHLSQEVTFGTISRALRTYPVVSRDAPVFKMCRSGDLKGLQAAFSDGNTSPLVLDTNGWTLLHVSISNFVCCGERVVDNA